MPVDRLKKKKDGTPAYLDECQGVGLIPASHCNGEVEWVGREAASFGQPFVTHAYMCPAHAVKFGYSK